MKRFVLLGSFALLILLIVFLVVFLLQGMVELGEIAEQGKDLIQNEQNAQTPEDPSENEPTTPPTEDPVIPSEDEDPFTAVDNSNAAKVSIFNPGAVGSKTGIVADDLSLIGPSLNDTLPDGLIIYENGTMEFTDTTPGWYYEVGMFEGEFAVMPRRLYYRAFRNGAWENSVHIVDGSNFIVYLEISHSYGGTEPYQRYDGSFTVSERSDTCTVAIALAENFTPDFEAFRLYVLAE